MHKAKTAGNVV